MIYLNSIVCTRGDKEVIEKDILRLTHNDSIEKNEGSMYYYHPITLNNANMLSKGTMIIKNKNSLLYDIVTLGPYGSGNTNRCIYTQYSVCRMNGNPVDILLSCGYVQKLSCKDYSYTTYTNMNDSRLSFIFVCDSEIDVHNPNMDNGDNNGMGDDRVHVDCILMILIRGDDQEDINRSMKDEYSDYVSYFNKYRHSDVDNNILNYL